MTAIVEISDLFKTYKQGGISTRPCSARSR